jgi:N-acetylglutamate synthase-like GNAT family acetyltransferase
LIISAALRVAAFPSTRIALISRVMNVPQFRIRRATVDDLAALRALWTSMRLSADELEKRLIEFQVIEAERGPLLGAIGIQIAGSHALLHSEGYTDFAAADSARELFWQRIQILAANHGVFRLWTQERSPFWTRFGFQPANTETLVRLPNEWKNEFEGAWLTMQLKDEKKIADALEKEFATFMQSEKMQSTRVSEQARTLKTTVTVIAFAIAILCFGVAIYLLLHRNSLGY